MQVRRVAALSLLCLLCVQAATADTVYWTGAGTDNAWTTSGNWNVVPVSGDDVVFVSNPFSGAQTTALISSSTTIGTLTFSEGAPSGFAINVSGTPTLTLSGLTVSGTTAGPVSYTVNPTLAPSGSSFTFNIGDNSTLVLASRLNAQTVDFVKSGAGMFNSTFPAGGSNLQINLHSLDIQAGSYQYTQAHQIYGGLKLANSATLFSSSNQAFTVGYNCTDGDSSLKGVFVMSGAGSFNANGPGTMTISGNGQIFNGNNVALGFNEGKLVLDDTGTMLSGTNRISTRYAGLKMNNLLIKGNDTQLTAENYTGNLTFVSGMNSIVSIKHGSAAVASAYFAQAGAFGAPATNSAMFTLYALDENGNYENPGTDGDFISANFATAKKSFFFTANNDGAFTGDRFTTSSTGNALRIMANGRAGAYTKTDGTFVTSEFLTLAGTVAYRYSGAGRQSDINLAMAGTMRQVTNYELTTPQVVSLANPTIGSLKLTNVGLDLGGQTLSVGSWNRTTGSNVFAQVNSGAGIIVTGTLVSSTSLSNGTLAARSGNCIFLTNDIDFEVKDTATLSGAALVKTGTGMLKLSGSNPVAISWMDGGLEYNSLTDNATVKGYVYGAGQFIKDGSTSVTLTGNNWTTGGMLIHGGTVTANGGTGAPVLGTGPVTLDNDALLVITANSANRAGDFTLNDNSVVKFTGAPGLPIYGGATLNDQSYLYYQADSGTNGNLSWNGLVTVGSNAVLYHSSVYGTVTYKGGLVVKDQGVANVRGGVVGSTTIQGNGQLTVTGGTFDDINISGHGFVSTSVGQYFDNITMTDDARISQSGIIGTWATAAGFTATLRSGGTIGITKFNGPVSLSDYTDFNLIRGWYNGPITMSGTAIARIVPGVPVNFYDNLTIGGDAQLISAATTGNRGTFSSSGTKGVVLMTANDRALVDIDANDFHAAITANGDSRVNIFCTNGFNGDPYGTITTNNQSRVILKNGGGIVIANVNDTSYLSVYAPSGLISVATNAHLNISGGNVTSNIDTLVDTRDVTFGGGYTKAGLWLSSTLTGPKTLNLVDWQDPSFRYQAQVDLGNLWGSGTITRNGGPNVTMTMEGADNWNGNVVNNTGVLMFTCTTGNVPMFPAGLGKIVLGSAQSTLFMAADTNIGTTVSVADRNISGLGTISVDNHVDIFPYLNGGNKLSYTGGVLQAKNGALSVSGDLEFAMSSTTGATQVIISSASGSSYGSLNVTSSDTTVHGKITGLSNATLTFDFRQTGPALGDWNAFQGAVMTVVSSADSSQLFFSSTSWNGNNMRGLVVYGPGTITVSNVHNTVIPGDGNGDMKVDVADYTLYFNNYGNHNNPLSGYNDAAWYPGDMNGDGNVDVADYTLYFNNYGDHSGGGSSAVPEPATMALLTLGGLAILRRRK